MREASFLLETDECVYEIPEKFSRRFSSVRLQALYRLPPLAAASIYHTFRIPA